jgi:uncharacterized protein YtpQ (UPF0354 family)
MSEPPDVVTFSSRAVALLKPEVFDDDAEAIELSDDDSPVLRPFVPPLLVSYLVDTGEQYSYVQSRHLREDGLDAAALHAIGLDNLSHLSSTTTVRRAGSAFAVVMGGGFEASLMLLDWIWDDEFRQYVKGDYAVAVPARDILAFCDASSSTGVHELRQIVQRVYDDGDHLLTKQLYVRRHGLWSTLPDN